MIKITLFLILLWIPQLDNDQDLIFQFLSDFGNPTIPAEEIVDKYIFIDDSDNNTLSLIERKKRSGRTYPNGKKSSITK